MKKSVIKALSVLLIGMFLLAAATTAISAASVNTLKLTLNKKGFTYTVYQVATLDTANGSYTLASGVDASVKTAVNTKNQSGEAFLAVLDAAAQAGKNVGASVGTLSVSADAADGTVDAKEFTVAGIYYARVTGYPDNKTKMSNSVIVWPEYRTSTGSWDYMTDSSKVYTVDLGTKVDSGTDNVTKYFTDNKTAAYINAAQGDVVKFTLEADIVGSDAWQAGKYVIWDKMAAGLSYNDDMTISYDDETTDVSAKFDIAQTAINDSAEGLYDGGTYFTITAKADTLDPSTADGAAFYGHSKVYVRYSATVTNAATLGKNYNPNIDGMTYNTGDKDIVKTGREVKVYTYTAQAVKVDASASSVTPLAGATLGLYSDGSLIASGVSGTDGVVVFKKDGDANAIRLAPGSYTVKEIEAPSGYALSTVTYPLTVTEALTSDGVFSLDGDAVVENYATKLPATGGAGTWMFTLIGAGLVLIAGALLVIALRKKSVK